MGGLIGIAITTTFGVILTFLLGGNFRKSERVSLALLVGFGLQTFAMFISYIFGLRFTLANTLLEVGAIMFIGLSVIFIIRPLRKTFLSFINLRNIFILSQTQIKNLFQSTLTTKLIWLVLLGLVISSLIIGAYFPVYGWDSLVLYNFRAITFVTTGGMEDGIARGYFFGYPLMTSLAHTWMYFLKANPHLFYWAIYVGFLGVIYHCLRPFLSKFTLMLTLLIIATLPSVYTGSYFDYTNFPYNVFLVSGILYICRYLKDNQKSYLIIAALLTGLSTWVRQTEPFWVISLVSIIILLAVETRRKFMVSIFWILLALVLFFSIQQPWRIFEARYIGAGRNITDQAGYALSSIQAFNLGRVIDVIYITTEKTLPTWQPYLLIAFFVVLFLRKYINKAKVFLYFVISNILLLYFGTYVFSLIWPESWKDIIGSQQRLSSFIVLLLIVFIAIISDKNILHGKEILEKLFRKGIKKVLE